MYFAASFCLSTAITTNLPLELQPLSVLVFVQDQFGELLKLDCFTEYLPSIHLLVRLPNYIFLSSFAKPVMFSHNMHFVKLLYTLAYCTHPCSLEQYRTKLQ